MNKKEYLTEENYNKTKGKLSKIAIIILLIGVGLGGFLIFNGLKSDSPSTRSLDELTKELEAKKAELIAKGVEYNDFTTYEDGEAYDLKIITKALDPSFAHCKFDEYKNNSITKEYCSVKNSDNSMPSFSKISSIIFGAFIIIASCMGAGMVYFISKRREILAFSAQQVMPIAKEGAEKMAPTAGKVAKEIAKGIKEGLNDNE